MNIMRSRLALFFTLTLVGIIAVIFIVGSLLTNRVNAYVLNLTDKIAKKVGNPVTVEKVTTKWDWLFLKVGIKNLIVTDQVTNTPVFMAGEIISTVDALDSVRTFSLKFKHLLIRNPRLVMQWDGTDTPTILGLGQADTSGDINPAAMLKMLAMQRKITVENGDIHLQGNSGADLPLMNVKLEFNFRNTNEYTLVARGNIAAAIQPEFVIAANYYGSLQDYDASMVDFEVKTSNIQLAELFNFIPKYRQDIVQGEFEDFDLRGNILNGTLRNIKSDFSIKRIIVAKDTIVKGGVGQFEFVPGSNSCTFKISQSTITNESLFAEPLNIDSIGSTINYKELENDTLDIVTENAKIQFMGIDAHPTIDLQIHDNQLQTLHFDSDLADASVRKLLELLPDKKMSPALIKWFDSSLISGTIDRLKLNYAKEKLAFSLGFKNTELKYSNDWPSVHNIDATLAMQNGKLSLSATHAMILNQSINSLNVIFTSHQNMPYAVVNINGEMDTTLAKGLEFLQQTPLKKSLGDDLALFKPTGAIGLDLKLKINVADTVEPVKVAGNVKLNNDSLQAPNIDVVLNNINGNIKFTNNSVHADNLRLNVLGQDAVAKIAMDERHSSVMRMSIMAPLQVSDLQKLLPNIPFTNFAGSAKVFASIDIPLGNNKQSKVVNVNSDLFGININYPPPLNKEANTKMPLHLQYVSAVNDSDSMRIKYAGLVDAILFLHAQKLKGGHVAINTKLDLAGKTDTLHVVGNIKYFDWPQWQPIFKLDSSASTMPIALNLMINTLKLEDSSYENLKLKYTSKNNELYIDSPVATGTLLLDKINNKIIVNLDKLNLPEQKASNNNKFIDYLQEQRAQNKLPIVQFSCDKLTVKKHVFKNINLDLTPHNYGYEITNFSVINDYIKLMTRGRWHMEDKPYTVITGSAHTTNFGKVLEEWGYMDSMSRGKGEMNFSVQWDGAPSAFDIFSLTGNSHLNLRSGNLTSVNPGLGRIIGLLSFETIQRRLQLDFSDLISKGFAFDKLIADVRLEPGRLTSENILINSPAAKIEMYGKTGIKSKELDFTMFVTPKVGASLPIAAAIAAGPAVGAAIWLFDKASGSKISELTKYKYFVTGTWDKPKIDEITETKNRVGTR